MYPSAKDTLDYVHVTIQTLLGLWEFQIVGFKLKLCMVASVVPRL